MKLLILLFLFIFLSNSVYSQNNSVNLVIPPQSSQRAQFGAEKLKLVLKEANFNVNISNAFKNNKKAISIIIVEREIIGNFGIPSNLNVSATFPGKEGFTLKRSENVIVICGADASGTLYGCMELAQQIKQKHKIPDTLDITDQPEMVIRGTCIGLQKPYYLPGRTVYEYPYTPETFPWFYDKELWLKYLDMLLENRMNSVYLWNGHPFASLVKLPDYPYAVEVEDSTFRKNEEMFSFITNEANKRGIWIIQMFYNIIVSKPFAEHYNIKTQDRQRPITPLISDYTRKSVAAFVSKYPNVGLLVCLGEAMNTYEDDVQWFTQTIIPGVKDGLKKLGRTDEPPVILRSHDTDAKMVIDAALPLYKNLYTMSKYNGESLTTYEPRGPWTKTHQELSRLGSVHIENVHILANLEPFRYASPDFIQKSVQAMHKIHGANGLHLYPQASYWDWPYSADNISPRLLEMDRDQMWYETWARYAWNCNRKRASEINYFANKLGEKFGCGKHGTEILEAYEQTGEIAPKLLRRFGITDGNRQTLLLGMFMSQLVNPYKYNVYSSFYESNGPEGEILLDYAEREWNKTPHKGETPVQIIKEVLQHGKLAANAINKATPFVTTNTDEFARLKNDIYCYQAFANSFAAKVEAALYILRYKYTQDITDLEKAIPLMDSSLVYYRKLADLTKSTYLYANSMQTQQRRIPVSGEDAKNKTWAELLPQYEQEYFKFKNNVEKLKNSSGTKSEISPLTPGIITILSPANALIPLQLNEYIDTDKKFSIKAIAPELSKLSFVRLNQAEQEKNGTELKFKNDKPVKVLVGYLNGSSRRLLAPPALETDANANDRGQADLKIANALDVPDFFPVNVYSYYYEPGEHTLTLGKGLVLILGFIDGNQDITTRDAGLGTNDKNGGIDWLFY